MQTGSLVNEIYSNSTGAPKPEVGMGATVLAWTDRYAGTIIEVNPNGSFVVQEDKATRVDGNGMSEAQEYTYAPDPNGRLYQFAPVRRGKAQGQVREKGLKDGRGVLVGRRQKYHDYSF
jgi:hypothetical protein